MFKLFFKGDSVPPEILSFHRRSHESILPKKVEFLRAVIVTSKDGEFHIRPLLGITKVNCIHIDEIGECIIKGGDNGVVIHVIPLINSFTLPLILSIFLAIFYVW